MFQVVDLAETDSSCPEPRTNIRFAQPKPIRSTETDSTEITGLMSRDRMSESESGK